jgi:hypothetical protein
MVMRTELEVDNPSVAAASTGTTAVRTLRRTVSSYYAPFLRVMEISYPNGRRHSIVTSATPVSDGEMRLIQWCIRNDTEDEAPAADVVAFDRQVTLEDRALLEQTWPDYALDLTANVHLKVDRPTIEIQDPRGNLPRRLVRPARFVSSHRTRVISTSSALRVPPRIAETSCASPAMSSPARQCTARWERLLVSLGLEARRWPKWPPTRARRSSTGRSAR